MSPAARTGAVLAAALAVLVAVALLTGPVASGEPDVLERVAIDQGLAAHERPHALADLPTAGYSVPGVGDERLGAGLAGVLGVVSTFALTAGLLAAVRRTSRARADARR